MLFTDKKQANPQVSRGGLLLFNKWRKQSIHSCRSQRREGKIIALKVLPRLQ